MRYIAAFVLLICAVSCIGNPSDFIPIVPSVKTAVSVEGSWKIEKQVTIVIVSPHPGELRLPASELIQTLKEYNSCTAVIGSGSAKGDIRLIEDPGDTANHSPRFKGMHDEAYRLSISREGVVIRSASAHGLFYGCMSLVQLLEKVKDNRQPCVEIQDWPDFPHRGVSDDISRGQVSTLENFKRIIRFMARHKMNTYMPYMEDMMEFSAYPSIGKNRGALSKAEVKELVAYAKQYFVEVVPVFQTLGHYENILSRDEFLKYADFPGSHCLDVTNDSVYVFLENMLKEVFDVFPSEYFHMGADESWDVGLGNSKSLVDSIGIAAAHAMHYKKVLAICKKYGKKVLMYGDILISHKELLTLVPKEITIVDWMYGDQYRYGSSMYFDTSGFRYYASPAVWNWQNNFPNNFIAMPNIEYMARSGYESHAAGLIVSNWGDYGAEQFKELVLFGYAWAAQCGWNLYDSDAGVFSKNYFNDFFGVEDDRPSRIYQSLSSPSNMLIWHDVWHHPALPMRQSKWWLFSMSGIARTEWMDWTLPQTMKDIDVLESKARKNKDHLAILRYEVKLVEWFRLKTETQYMLTDRMSGVRVDDKKLISLLNENIERLSRLRDEYRLIWLKYYKEDNLWMIEDKFNRLISYFEETRTGIEGDTLVVPRITSKWIYAMDPDSTYLKQAVFRKEFTLSQKPDSAWLQLMGDTYVKLYINGKYVDQVFARRSLSLGVDYDRIKWIDILPFLQTGNNEIRVETRQYNPKGNAGFNLIAQLSSGSGVTELISDESWLMEKKISEKTRVVAVPYPYEVTQPDFNRKRTSWIER